MFAWAISMMGWFKDPHRAEKNAVEDVYSALVDFCEAIGSQAMIKRRNMVIESLINAEDTLSSRFLSKKNKMEYNRLVILNQNADDLLLELIEITFLSAEKLPEEIINMVRELNENIKLLNKDKERVHFSISYEYPQEEYRRLTECLSLIRALVQTPVDDIESEVAETVRPSRRMSLKRAMEMDFIVFASSVRHAIVLMISALIAFNYPFVRPDWIPLSCAAVMFGTTIMTTFNRAVLRCAGTIMGTFIATAILDFNPAGIVIAPINMILTAITELVVVRNYALVAMFLTPNAILLADAVAKDGDPAQFLTGRVTTVAVGSLIGLAGTYIIGRKSASSRLPGLTAKLIRSQARAIVRLEANKENGNIHDTQWIRGKMEINLANLKLAYNTALGEIPANHENLELMWPMISSLEHINYLIAKNVEGKKYMILSSSELSKILLIFEKIATAVEQKHMFKNLMPLDIETIPKISSEINHIQEIISIKNIYE